MDTEYDKTVVEHVKGYLGIGIKSQVTLSTTYLLNYLFLINLSVCTVIQSLRQITRQTRRLNTRLLPFLTE